MRVKPMKMKEQNSEKKWEPRNITQLLNQTALDPPIPNQDIR